MTKPIRNKLIVGALLLGTFGALMITYGYLVPSDDIPLFGHPRSLYGTDPWDPPRFHRSRP